MFQRGLFDFVPSEVEVDILAVSSLWKHLNFLLRNSVLRLELTVKDGTGYNSSPLVVQRFSNGWNRICVRTSWPLQLQGIQRNPKPDLHACRTFTQV